MPQTLLAISAIVITGFLTLSQGNVTQKTTESIVKDQFELAVAGTLLHTMEFIDSRAFDEATTPEKLLKLFGLPLNRVMTLAERDTISFDDLSRRITVDMFTKASDFGTGHCDIENQRANSTCDDIDDIANGRWLPVDLKTPEGDPLPVEVRVEVAYVRAGVGEAIDEPILDAAGRPHPDVRTFHKRVEVFARSNAIKMAGGGHRPVEVSLRRVISFDPEVAAEYLRRSIRILGEGPGTCAADLASWNESIGELRQSAALRRVEATSAQARARQAREALGPLQSATQAAEAARTARIASAQAALTSAQAARATAQADYTAAIAAKSAADAARATAAGHTQAWYYWLAPDYFNGLLAQANRDVASASAAVSAANGRLSTATRAVTAAQTAASQAQSPAETDAARAALAAAQAAAAQADAAAAQAAEAADAAEAQVADFEATQPSC